MSSVQVEALAKGDRRGNHRYDDRTAALARTDKACLLEAGVCSRGGCRKGRCLRQLPIAQSHMVAPRVRS
jgi:hypothetical protein